MFWPCFECLWREALQPLEQPAPGQSPPHRPSAASDRAAFGAARATPAWPFRDTFKKNLGLSSSHPRVRHLNTEKIPIRSPVWSPWHPSVGYWEVAVPADSWDHPEHSSVPGAAASQGFDSKTLTILILRAIKKIKAHYYVMDLYEVNVFYKQKFKIFVYMSTSQNPITLFK